MSIRTVDDLSGELDSELAWRKKELSDLKYFMDQAGAGAGRRRVLGRCGVAILYAHWEGFVKLASRYFLEFVAMQRLPNGQLGPNLLTLSLRSTISFSPEMRKHSEFGKITDFFLTKLSHRARFPFKTGLNTEANLSSSVLKEITWCLGIDYSPYQTKEKFIDSRLLGRRNHIAHGEGLDVDPDEFDEMRATVLEMMTCLKTELENSAALKTYLK
jgi:RiboL-PSP-HEPN